MEVDTRHILRFPTDIKVGMPAKLIMWRIMRPLDSNVDHIDDSMLHYMYDILIRSGLKRE